jgi:hypothetical protein
LPKAKIKRKNAREALSAFDAWHVVRFGRFIARIAIVAVRNKEFRMATKEDLETLELISPGSRKKGRDAIEARRESVASESAKLLAKSLASDPRVLAELLMGGFQGLKDASASTLEKLSERYGVYDPIEMLDDSPMLAQGIEEMLWPRYWAFAAQGKPLSKQEDAALANALAANPHLAEHANAQILLREGMKGSLLSACLLMQAFDSARVLLDAGANPKTNCAGDLGTVPSLYFAVRSNDAKAGALAAEMIRKGADPWAGAPSAFSFDHEEDDRGFAMRSARGQLVKWMIFHGHNEPLYAALSTRAKSNGWIKTLKSELEGMGWGHSDVGKLLSAMERGELFKAARLGAGGDAASPMPATTKRRL